jgi:subtilisin family serine protease
MREGKHPSLPNYDRGLPIGGPFFIPNRFLAQMIVIPSRLIGRWDNPSHNNKVTPVSIGCLYNTNLVLIGNRFNVLTPKLQEYYQMRMTSRLSSPFLILLFISVGLAQTTPLIENDKFFIKLTQEAFEVGQREDVDALMELAGVAEILGNTDNPTIAPAFQSMVNQVDPYGLKRVFIVQIQPSPTLQTLIADLNELPDVEYAEPMYKRELYDTQFTPNDPYFSQSWHHPVVQTPEAWDIQTGSETIIVAIIDTGVDTSHPDLMENLWQNPNEIPGNGVDDDLNGHIDDLYGWDFTQDDADVNHEWNWHPYNSEDHGTHCAGIAAGVTNNDVGIAGASHHSKIMTCKIFPYTTDAAAADAILYAANNGAHVISNSWGGGGSSNTIQSAILHARNVRDAVVLFAAGNDGSSSPHYPGANDGVVCVGATNSSDNRASFSNYGSWVDMCAPGTGIWSCVDRDNPAHEIWYAAWDGTSMATPLAAGIAALIRSQFPNMSAPDVEARLMDGDDVGNLQMGLRVNALKALTAFNISHVPLTNVLDPGGDLIISAEIFAEAGATFTVTLYYANSGSNFATLNMSETEPGVYTATIPAQEGGSIIEYYIQAEDGDGNQVFHPLTAPETPHFFTVGGIGYFTTHHFDDLESTTDWTVGISSDDATSGIWVLEDPIGTLDGGEAVQPEDDHSEPGSLCFVTGNAPFTGDNSGDNDVDGGATTLLSPVYNLPPGVSAILSYWRWYSNDLGQNPGEDPWEVQARFNEGDWQILEQTTTSNNSWTQKQFLMNHYSDNPTSIQLKFIADDSGSGSLVEAAVDDLRIYYSGETTFIPGDVNLDMQINIQDLILLVGHILGNSTLTGNAVFAADFNVDGDVNIQDVVTLVSAILD